MHARAYTVGAVAVMIAWVLLTFVGVGGALPTMAMLLAMGALLTRRRRVLAKGVDVVLVDDGRAPVLFLRSFKDDTIKLRQRQELFGLMGLQKIRFEETPADMVGQYGPLLAVGEPSEGLPQLGAARAYLADDAWRSQVQRWIGESRMIAMLCGPTRWVHWEMQNIVAAQRLSALLLFLPPGRKAAGGVARRRLERWDQHRELARRNDLRVRDARAGHRRRAADPVQGGRRSGRVVTRNPAHLAVYGDPEQSWMAWHARAISVRLQDQAPIATRVAEMMVEEVSDWRVVVYDRAASGD
jgi:hypothetical protein